MLNDVDNVLKMKPEDKKLMMPALGKHFTVEIFNRNVERLRGYTFYPPLILSFKKSKSEPHYIGAGLIARTAHSQKLYKEPIVYYKGRWAFGYVGN